MYRYLLNLSYIGTCFRGAQKQINSKLVNVEDNFTIQGQIETGLKSLQPANLISVVNSSRTDAGVHALHSTMHVDLIKQNGEPYDPSALTLCLNKRFQREAIPIRILNTFLVPNTFHCRTSAISRTYMYRLVIVRNEFLNVASLKHHIPIEEFNRALFLCTSTFDVDTFKDVTKLFLGLHDFRTFMGRGSRQKDKITRRAMDKLDIIEVNSSCYSSYSWPCCMFNDVSDYKFYNVVCTSKGFLYNQVRRTIGALIAVAQGKVTTRDIKFMLEVPSHNSWDPRIRPVPAHGLYLCQVAYNKCDIQTFKAKLEK